MAAEDGAYLICRSRSLRRIPYLKTLLGGLEVRGLASGGRPPEAVLTWGEKEHWASRRSAAYAAARELPIWRAEDGFLRSLTPPGQKGEPQFSLVLDKSGIYYDATRPSDLETILASEGWETPELLAEARAALEAIVENDLSKYNHAPAAPPDFLGRGDRPRILLLDQTRGDVSVRLGQAGPETFAAMLEAARREHPAADLFVKTHPEVISGRKRGYLPLADAQGARVIGENYSPLSLLRQADEVYVVSSQMGLEALFLGKTVHCFGLPFYAGWGLTRDRQSSPRRARRRTLEELFAAAYILYSRYVNPVTGEAISIGEAVRLLALQRSVSEANRVATACFGFRKWKREHARRFLAAPGSPLEFFDNYAEAENWAEERGGRIVVWGNKLDGDAFSGRVPLHIMEDGFLRSAGLGFSRNRPYSLVLDDLGIYYDPRRESRLERLLATRDFAAEPALTARASRLRERLVAAGISKYNVGARDFSLPPAASGRRVVLVPGQVEDDASIQSGAAAVSTNLGLLKAARAARPDAFIIYKSHPDVEIGRRQGAVAEADVLRLADLWLRDADMSLLLGHCQEVHTITSLTGFEALLRGLEVATYGAPFYAGWGLTEDHAQMPRRGRSLSLDELCAAALILYPRYFDWVGRQFCGPEEALHRLAHPPAEFHLMNTGLFRRLHAFYDKGLHFLKRLL